MTFTKEEVYKDVQILNPGLGDRYKKMHNQEQGQKMKSMEVWHAGSKEICRE